MPRRSTETDGLDRHAAEAWINGHEWASDHVDGVRHLRAALKESDVLRAVLSEVDALLEKGAPATARARIHQALIETGPVD